MPVIFIACAGDALAEFGVEELGDRGLVVRDAAVLLDGDDDVAEHLGDGGLDPAVGEFVFSLGAGAAGGGRVLVLLPEAHVVLERLALADGVADGRALEVERGGADVPAAVDFAEDVLGGHAHVFEEDFVEHVRCPRC